MNPNVSVGVAAHYRFQVTEKQRLIALRKRGFSRHANFARWAKNHGTSFRGDLAHYSALPEAVRRAIDREIAQDVLEYPKAWEESPVVAIPEDRPKEKNLVLDTLLDWCCTANLSNFVPGIRYHCLGSGTSTPTTSDTLLGNEIRRSGTYLTGSGNLGSSWAGDTITFRQTFDHAIETVGKNYTEHGLSSSGSSGATITTRSLISGGTLTAAVGQQVRCIYDVSATVSPATATALTVTGEGWGSEDCSGQMILLSKDTLLGVLNASGAQADGAFLLGGEYTYNDKTAYVASATTLPGFGTTPSIPKITGSEIDYINDAYVAGSFARTFRPVASASAGAWSSTGGIQGWVFGISGSAVLFFRYNTLKTKASTHTLRYPSFTVSWARA